MKDVMRLEKAHDGENWSSGAIESKKKEKQQIGIRRVKSSNFGGFLRHRSLFCLLISLRHMGVPTRSK
ncbi:hypothetical protein EUGRSUZ_B03283 [Eucalyptus grandis]|uniref:Uncharacterized protein n=2 Tax=Eucalyptus grandis TaxID=71139 RepID=A0ACC3LWC8_EUCGR|nr:hypothetical protein EUGRSUZ_B03283 [Eucalyptus grandis]